MPWFSRTNSRRGLGDSFAGVKALLLCSFRHRVRLGFCPFDPVQPIQQRFWPDSQPLVERLGREFFRQLPESPGVYLMHGSADVVLYVGKARSLRHRLSSYRVANPERMKRRTLRLLRLVQRIAWEECADEASALARESELLRSLKPRFNRAGVWAGARRYLVWRNREARLELAITEAPATGWQIVGPFGGGMIYLRASLARLLWFALNNPAGSVEMPEGWLHGRFGPVARLSSAATNTSEANGILERLFEGDAEGFAAWIGGRTQSLQHKCDLEIRDADLESVLNFIETMKRRSAPVLAANGNVARGPADDSALWLFPNIEWNPA